MSLESIGVLAEHERLRARARGDQRASSVPLVGLGVLVAGSLPFDGMASGSGRLLYWLIATPLLLVGTWWWQRRASIRTGQTRPRQGYLMGAGVVLAAFVLVFPLLFLFPVTAPCAVLLVMALVRRNWYLASWSVVLGFLGALVQLGFFDNRLYDLNLWWRDYRQPESGGYFAQAATISHVGLVLLILGVALHARYREQR